jgi:molecular chaperone GrpE
MTKKPSDKKDKKIDYKKVAEELAAENAQLNESLLRERADAENVRRRADQERTQLASFFKASAVKELLPAIDNLERAMQQADDSEFAKGVLGIHKQFMQALEKIGVERIKTVGEHFDPNTMEAVTMEEGDGKEEIVSEELQSGYKLGEELLRPAMVRVKG